MPVTSRVYDTVALLYAVTAADLLSFARAAAEVGVKQSTLSRRISHLESRLGIILFERSTRGAVPTSAGQTFLIEARKVLANLAALYSSGRAIGSGETGSLGLGISTSLASGNTRQLIRHAFEQSPAIRITPLEGDRCRLVQALHGREVDLAIIPGDRADLGLRRRFLWSERVMAILADTHRLASKDRIYWSDLREDRFALPRLDPGLALAELTKARLSEPGWQPQIDIHEVTRDNIAHILPLSGYISLTTDAAVGPPVPGVNLREVFDVTGSVAQVDFYGYWREETESAPLRRILALLKQRFPSPLDYQ